MKNQHAVELGKIGRSKNTTAQAASSRENGKKGGRPRKIVGTSNGSTFWVDKNQNGKSISKYMAIKCAVKFYRNAFQVKDVDIDDMRKNLTVISHQDKWEIII